MRAALELSTRACYTFLMNKHAPKNRILTLLTMAGFILTAQAWAGEQATVKIKGMTCAACVKTVKKNLVHLPQVAGADVQVGQAVISLKDGQKLDAAAIKAVIEKAGYVVEDVKFSAGS